jgi:hypothetical protein
MAVPREWIEPGTTVTKWLLVCVPAPANARLHTPNYQPYDRYRLCAYRGTYLYDREHVAACEDIPQSLQPAAGLCYLASPFDDLTHFIRIAASIDERETSPALIIWLRHSQWQITYCSRRPIPSTLSSSIKGGLVGEDSTTDYVRCLFVVLCASHATENTNYCTTF